MNALPAARSRSRMGLWEVAAILLITVLAAALRFYRLPEVPPGLHFDEGFKGVTARGLLEGAPPQLFFESDMGEEPIALYLVAAALGLVGEETWVIRLPSAILGTVTVPLAWWLGRELFAGPPPRRRRRHRNTGPEGGESASSEGETVPAASQRGPLIGLGAALVLAILYWHLSFSRIGMEPILVPFFAALAFAALARGLNTGGRFAFGLAGLALGGSLYTYKAGYFVPVLAVLFVGLAALLQREFLRRHGRGLLLAAGVALLVATPIVVYFATHPANFLQRPASVALAGDEGAGDSAWQAWSANLPRVLGMFFLEGDVNPRSNLPGRPALDPFLALLFLAGLARAVVESLRGRALLALAPLWLVVMVLPTLVTEHAPHFGRAIGATPALALLCALGGWWLWWIVSRQGRRWLQVGVALLLTAGLLYSGFSTAHTYFSRWSHSPDLFYAYDVGLTRIAKRINAVPAGEYVYLTPTAGDHFTLEFLVERPFSSFDGRSGLVLPPRGRAATILVLVREDKATLPALQKVRPDGAVTWTATDGYDRPYAVAYRLPPVTEEESTLPLPARAANATLGESIGLLGYSLQPEAVAPGDTVYLSLHWQALAPMDEDYTVFGHLLGEHNPATDGPLWAGHDGQPVGGSYPTSAWQPGQVILDVHPLAIPAGTPPGEYQLEAGLYLLATMERLGAVDGIGQPLPGDAVPLGSIRVGE